MDILNIVGLTMNLVGALFLAFSTSVVDPSSGTGSKVLIMGKKITITTIKRKNFNWGIGLLIIGFVLQIIGTI